MAKKNTAGARTDQQLALATHEAIEWLTTISQDTITVTAHDGYLDLDGRVPSLRQRTMLEDVARTLPGVRGVTNLICVQADPYCRDVGGVTGQRGDAIN